MCFRPATVEASAECPSCGKRVNAVQGAVPKKCPFCKTALGDSFASQAGTAPDIAVAAPQAPAAPERMGGE